MIHDTALAHHVTVRIQRNAHDYREAYAWLRWRSWTWPAITAGSIVASGALLAGMGRSAVPYVGLLAVFVVAWYFASLRRIASRMQKAHVQNGTTSYTFNADGFQYRSDVGRSETCWAAVNRAVETRRSFLLLYENTCFLIIPKHCMAPGDVPLLRGILRTIKAVSEAGANHEP